MRYFFANFKANPKNISALKTLLGAYARARSSMHWSVVLFPPFPFLHLVKSAKGAQNLFWEEGAYTGEVTGAMIRAAGCRYVLVGHSERRHIFGESNKIVNKKLKASFTNGLIPVLCVGEKKEERARRDAVLAGQLTAALKGVRGKNALFIAYEPVWAIGTGFNDTPARSKAARETIVNTINRLGGSKIARRVCVLYGGSVNSKNFRGYLDVGFDGLLVGGASLKSKEFTKIIKGK